MRRIFYVFISVVFIACQSNTQQPVEKFKINRGTNAAHWLSQSSRRGTERLDFFTKADVQKIAEMGFDHIRLPIDEEQMWDTNGNRYNEAFELMLNFINWCAANDLRVIVDLHILRSHHFNVEEKPLWTDPAERGKFLNLWRDLSNALTQFPNSLVAYELMNEAVADDPELWNELIKNAVQAIREIEPERVIVIGSNRWQSYNTFDELKVPENDRNIILSFHFYEPFLLTHYHASWTNLKDYEGPVHYPGLILTQEEFNYLPEEVKSVAENWIGKEFNKEVIQKMWQEPIQKARDLNLLLYCGEFGINAGPPEEDRLSWYRDMIDLFESNGIAYANWNYKSDNFGLFNGNSSPNDELIKIVSGK